MNRVESSENDIDLDIDLESGGTTSEDDENKVQHLSSKSSSNLLGGISSEIMLPLESPYVSRINTDDCSCSYNKLFSSDDEITVTKNKEIPFGGLKEETRVNFVDKGKHKKKKNCLWPPKPPRPPGGPSLHASDIKMLKEISELISKRKRMERMRTLRKTKKEKALGMNSSTIFPCLVTLIFLAVIIFQGLLGSRM